MAGKTVKLDLFRDTPPIAKEAMENLLNLLLAQLSPDQRIAKLTDALVMHWGYGEKAVVYLEALERAFNGDMIAFRRQLMQIYLSVPVREYESSSVVGLRCAILAEILRGWRVMGEDDTEVCFSFICKAYSVGEMKYPYKDLRHGIISIMRKYLIKDCLMGDKELDYWICCEETPGAIATALLHARVRGWNEDYIEKYPVPSVVAELRFIEPFDFRRRAIDAVELVKDYMKKVRIADELATKLAGLIRPTKENGEPNESSPIKSGEIFCHLQTADIVRCRVKFIYKKGVVDDSDDVFTKVKAARDKLLETIKYPPKILITIENPDGGIVCEEEG